MRNLAFLTLTIVSFSALSQELVRIGTPSGSNLPVSFQIEVLDAEDNQPIQRVNCRIIPINRGFSTDKDGKYELSLQTGKMRFIFTHLS